MKERNNRYDTARFLLIFLVVFAHLLEQFSGPYVVGIYRTIYLFHMPAFLFLSGVFARFDRKRILFRQVLPYLVFQPLYLLFDAKVLGAGAPFSLQYTRPYWLLWYLVAVMAYSFLIPFFDTEKPRQQALALGTCVVMSLAAGYGEDIGYYLSLSRILVFAPYFLLGFYWGKQDGRKLSAGAAVLCLGLALGGVVYAWRVGLNAKVLYGSYCYASLGYSPVTRLILLETALGGIGCMALLPRRKLPVITALGRNTFPVFCLHGFVVRYLGTLGIFTYGPVGNLALAAGIALCIVLVLGNPWTGRLFRLLFSEKRFATRK